MSSSQVLVNGHSAAHTPEPAHGVISTFVFSQDYQDIETEPVHDVLMSKIVISHDLQTVETEATHVPKFVTSNDHDNTHELQITDTKQARGQTPSKFANSPRIETKPTNNNETVKPKFANSHDHRPIETKLANTSKSLAIPYHDLQTIQEDEEVAGLNELKKMTTRLRLSTRRPSIMQWRENLTHFHENRGMSLDHDIDDVDGSWSDEDDDDVADGERRRKMDDAIAWLRQELTAMKTQDHQLAMQLMKLRAEIQELKLQKTSNEHQELIEDARYSIVEENEELKSALFDLPMNNNFFALNGGDDPLKDMGVTRMNLNRRRFSLR